MAPHRGKSVRSFEHDLLSRPMLHPSKHNSSSRRGLGKTGDKPVHGGNAKVNGVVTQTSASFDSSELTDDCDWQIVQPKGAPKRLPAKKTAANKPPQRHAEPVPAPNSERVEERWAFCQREHLVHHNPSISGALTASESIDTLMQTTGLESVKRSMVSMYERVQLSKLQNFAFSSSSYNLRCDGNPGTGKTTVARLYASFLVELGILPKTAQMKETSGSKLLSDGVKGLEEMLEELKEGGGGVVFVDETYQLNPATDAAGRKVLDFILPHAERMQGIYGQLVWIFAGGPRDMDKLFEHNPGLPSRFPHKFVFEDYTDEELQSILEGLMKRGGQDITPPVKKQDPIPKPVVVPVIDTALYTYYTYNPDAAAAVLVPVKDQWGNDWTFNPALRVWEDQYGNISGSGMKKLGTTKNPLMSKITKKAWVYDAEQKYWKQRDYPDAAPQAHYPGKAPPAPPIVSTYSAFGVPDVKWIRVAVRRLGRSRGKVGFGNARAVRALFEQAHARQTTRISNQRRLKNTALQAMKVMEFTRDDLLGPKPNAQTLKHSCPAWKKLLEMVGLDEVKASLEQLLHLAIINSDLEDEEKPLRGIALNRIFLGNPGTGKTTVAALYGQILCHLGLLSKGDVIYKTASDFLGSQLGSSETITRNIIENAEGCVLVIDEAYCLNPVMGGKSGGSGLGTADPYRTAVVDTIVEQVQGRPGEDRAVVMLGYRREMEDFLAAANPGLARRFQMENAFEFADYTDEQLVTILKSKCAQDQLGITDSTAQYAVAQLARARSMPHFGNAGALDNLLSVAKLNMGVRYYLSNEDFHQGGEIPEHIEEATLFDDLLGCDNVLAELKRIQSSIKYAQKKKQDIKSTFECNYLFVGPSGTGKTTVARKMGQMFFSLGLLPTSDVVEIKAADLATGFVGQSAHKAAEVIRRAKGKVLFIDEAYQLNPTKGGQFMQEAVDTLVQELSSKELKNKLVVILAGYEREIDTMLQSTNPGLRSRFSKKLSFEPFSSELVESILRKNLAKHELDLSEGAAKHVTSIAARLCNIHEFGNGRDAETLALRILATYAERTSHLEGCPLVEESGLDKALASMVASRKPIAAKAQGSGTDSLVPKALYQTQSYAAPPPPPPVTAIETAKEAAVEKEGEPHVPVGEEKGETARFLQALQNLLDQVGLNNKEGVARLARADLSGGEMTQLAQRLAVALGIDLAAAREMMRGWQSKQGEVEELVRQQEAETAKAKKEQRRALLPIWRCGVCGRADLPYIACYVQPFIAYYKECDV
eukprot:gene14867-17051_t